MAVKTVTRTTCDRCDKVIEEVQAKSADDSTAAVTPSLYVQRKDGEPLKFDDLCSKCEDRVDHLLKQLRLEKPTDDKDADKDSDKPSVETKKPESKDSPKGASKKPPKDKGGAGASPPSN